MAHIHGVYDTDTHFLVDPVKKELTVAEDYEKVKVIQHDHNSERFTFEMPRYIEGHDMSTCNKVEVHYLNVDSKTKEESKGLYPVDDLQISPENEDIVICSWLISGNATKYVGTLFFVLRLECNTEGTIDYAFNTLIYDKIYVGEGLYNSEAIATEYADVLEQWRQELINAGGGGSVSDEQIAEAVATYLENNPVEAGATEVQAKQIEQNTKDISDILATIEDLEENGGGGNSVVETTKTVSVGTEAVTLENGIKEQEVNLVWNVKGAGSVPAFENYYIEKSNISYPRTFNANGYTQFWSDANYHGNSEKYVSGHEYLQVFHYTMDGDSVAVLNKAGSPKYITPTNSENLTGSGWVYMLAKPTNGSAIVFNLTKTGTATGTIDYLYCIDITALQENGTITATTINELAELFGELPLIPGQNFEGKTTDGTANLTITRDGVDTIVPSSETTANVKSGDVLKTDNGTVVFSVIAQVIISASVIWADKKWVAFGDSLTDEAINADKKYYRHIEEKTGINVVVMGKGGTGYYITQDSGTCFYQRMANVPSDADVITILGSINDWKYYQHSIEVGTATDTLEDGTLCGYMNKCIDVAIEKAPYSQIALISAPYYHGLGTDRQEELCTALQGVARHRRVKFLDLYHESGFRIDNPTFAQQYTTDYSETDETFGHPNNAFHEKFLAPDFMELLKRMLLH